MERAPRYPVEDYRKELGERLTAAISRVKNKADVAHTIGISTEQMNKWLRGEVKVPAEGIRGIAKYTRVDFSWLVTGEGEMLQSTQVQSPRLPTLQTAPDAALVAGSNSMIRLPVYSEVIASAGPGAAPASELADGVISFEPLFLRNHGATPEKCVVIWARGDSMMPTIPNGAALIVDQGQTEISNGCIMVIGVGDDLLVKRIFRRLDGLIDLISDNTAYPPETLGPDALRQLRVVGRVIYFCRAP